MEAESGDHRRAVRQHAVPAQSGTAPERVDLVKLARDVDNPKKVISNQEYRQVDGLRELDLDPHGYRRIRLSRHPAG